MSVAVECDQHHKRCYPDANRGHTVGCLYPGCPEHALVPNVTDDPCYKPVRLIPRAEGSAGSYSPAHGLGALDLFQLVRKFMLARQRILTPPPNLLLHAWMESGSYSIKATSTDETVGKIVIYEDGKGTKEGAFPVLADGVYIWVRVDGQAAVGIWDGALEGAHQMVFSQLHPNTTLDVRHPPAPTRPVPAPCEERFAYFLLPPDAPMNPGDPTWVDIASFLAALSQV